MRISATLSLYIARQFLLWFFSFMLVIMAIIMLFDFIELVRRGSSKPDVTTLLTLRMTVMKVPEVLQDLFHFIVLFSAMFTFWRLTRSQELVIARAAGVSAWQFMLPVLAAAALIGVGNVGLLNPVGAAMFAKFEELENRFLRGRPNLLKVSRSGLWLRQRDESGFSVIFANSVNPAEIALNDVIIFLYDEDDAYRGRIDADSATLVSGYWDVREARITLGNTVGEPLSVYRLKTDLTEEKIQESFASPETLSFWDLPAFIRTLEETGFSALSHRMYYLGLLAQPLLLASMVLFAAAFSLRQTRRGGTVMMILAGIITGFILFILNDVVIALGLTEAVPAVLAAWSPACIALLIGTGTLLHLEDG